MLNAECSRQMNGQGLAGIRFRCDIETKYLKSAQIIYQVTLFDKRGRAIASNDKSYQVNGKVGATRTFMILPGRERIEGATVSIPRDQLEFGAADIPVTAEFAVFLPDGTCLAKDFRHVPVTRSAEVRPPLVPAGPEYWFAGRASGSSLPILLGPYGSAEEARRAPGVKPDRLVKFEAGRSLWFVPLRETTEERAVLIGPCDGEAPAARVAAALRRAVRGAWGRPTIAKPLSVTLGAWLAERRRQTPSGPPAEMVDALKRLGFDLIAPPEPPRKDKAPS